MLTSLGYILTDDIVVNYKNCDKDDSLHFLTHIDSNCTDIADYISPTAKRIYTSHYNAWYIKKRFKGKLIDVSGFNTDTSYKVTYKGNKYIYTFIDSKFATGSVALLLHGSFGTYLYTGNFSYYSAFVKSPVLLPVIEEKALTRIYLDNTYYEQPVDFFGFDDLADRIAKIIRSEPKKQIYLYADQVNTCPLLAEIASKVQEKVYICSNGKQIMTILGYGSFFTCDSRESRIYVSKAYINKRGHDENIFIQITRHDKTNENSTIFPKNERNGNSYNFHYYCHSTHKEICKLLSTLKPESMTCLFSDHGISKVNYNLDFKPDTISTSPFKSFSDKSICNSLSVEDAIKNNEEIGGSTTHENENTNVNSMVGANIPLLRVLQVAEINRSVSNVALSNEGSISMTSNASLNEEITNKHTTSNNLANPLISQNLHNYCKTKQTNNSSVKIYKPPGDGFDQTNAMPRDGKHPNVRKTQIDLPLVIDRKLVEEVTNSKKKLTGATTEKQYVVIDRIYIDSKNFHSGESCNQNSKSNNLKSANTEILKKQVAFFVFKHETGLETTRVSLLLLPQLAFNKSKVEELMCSKKYYKPLHQPFLLNMNMFSLHSVRIGNNSIPGLGSLSQTPETINNSESSPTNIISQNCIPDQEVFERNADKPGMAKKNTQESVSANQDLQENDKIIEIDEVVLNDTDFIQLHSGNNNGSMSEIIKKQLAFNNKSKIEELMASKTCYKPLHQPISLALNMSSSQTPEAINNSESSPTNRISQNCIPDQEGFERNADQPGGAKASAIQDLQENDKIIEIDEVVLNDTDFIQLHSGNNNGSMSEIIKKQLAFNNKSKIEELMASKTCYKPLHQPISLALNMSSSQTPEAINNSESSPTNRISQNCIPDQEVFERNADQPGMAKKNTQESVSANQDLQENNKIGEVEEDFLNNTNLSPSDNSNGCSSNETNLPIMDKDSCGIIENQSASVDRISGISNSPSKAVRPTDTSSSTDVTITHLQSVDIDNSMVSNSSNFTNAESINNNNKIENLDGKKKKSLKRALSVSVSDDESSNCRKKLRSEGLRMYCSDSNNSKQEDTGSNLKPCHVLLKRNAVERSYFFSRYHKCHMQKFCGFKKHEVRPRQHLLYLRNLQQKIEQLGSK